MIKRLLFLTVLFQFLVCFPQTEEIDSLLLDIAYQKQDTSKVNTSIKLIEALLKVGDYRRAFQFVEQTQDLAQSLDYPKGLANSYYYRALIYNRNNDYYNALDSFNKAKHNFELAGDVIGLAKVNNQIGILEIRKGNYQTGLRLSLNALEIFESNNMRQDLGEAYENLGQAYYNINQNDKALEFYLKAQQIQNELRQVDKLKSTNQILAELYSQRKEFRKSIEFYESTLKILNDSTDQKIKEQILPKLGTEYLEFNDWDKASNYLIEGLRLNRRSNNVEGLILTLNGLATLNLKRGNWRLAENQAEEAYTLLNSNTSSKLKLENYQIQKDIDSTRGNFEQAFLWQSRYFRLKQDIEEKQLVEQSQLSINGENQISDEESSTSIDNNTVREDSKSIKRQRLYLYLLGAALLIALIVLIISYGNQLKQKKESASLKEDLKALKKTNNELLASVEELEEKNTVKDRLFSIVSHDLKDSISSIKAFIDLLREDSLTREEFYDLIPELSENANNASLLLFNLLNWSKSQLQNLEPKPELFNIQDVFRDKIQLIQQRVEDKRIAIIDESQRDFGYADKSMVEIVIQNLLTNAVKFSRVGDIITISNKDKDGKALITVEDTGVGISEENLAKLFQKNSFTTIGTKNEKGTGLGLTICKELVELNNGKIWVESTPKVGTKFFVELPKSKPESN